MPQPFVVNCQLRQSIASTSFTCRVLFARKSHVSFSLRLSGRLLWKRKESAQRRGRITRYWLMLHPLCFNSFTLSGPTEIHLLSLPPSHLFSPCVSLSFLAVFSDWVLQLHSFPAELQPHTPVHMWDVRLPAQMHLYCECALLSLNQKSVRPTLSSGADCNMMEKLCVCLSKWLPMCQSEIYQM